MAEIRSDDTKWDRYLTKGAGKQLGGLFEDWRARLVTFQSTFARGSAKRPQVRTRRVRGVSSTPLGSSVESPLAPSSLGVGGSQAASGGPTQTPGSGGPVTPGPGTQLVGGAAPGQAVLDQITRLATLVSRLSERMDAFEARSQQAGPSVPVGHTPTRGSGRGRNRAGSGVIRGRPSRGGQGGVTPATRSSARLRQMQDAAGPATEERTEGESPSAGRGGSKRTLSEVADSEDSEASPAKRARNGESEGGDSESPEASSSGAASSSSDEGPGGPLARELPTRASTESFAFHSAQSGTADVEGSREQSPEGDALAALLPEPEASGSSESESSGSASYTGSESVSRASSQVL
ncbi:uncharacterized protein LOC112031839 [Quercus suber]|uniref:uncharacterized protein LOC112031839 n=1 Tax=Quercus suber TaxID=58331 RepID=UPI0032DF8EB6